MNKDKYDKDTTQQEVLRSLFGEPFKNQSFFVDVVQYHDEKGRVWKRSERSGFYQFSCLRDGEFVEIGYMKSYKRSIKTIHEAFIG